MTRFGAKNSGDTIEASETNAGIIEIATQAETDAGTDDARAVTPAKLANYSGLGGGGGSLAVQEDGVSEGTGIATLNFTTGLDVSVASTTATISATGGGGSGNISGAYDIEAGTYTDAGMSDEFASGTLDAQWTTAVSSGTIDFPGQPATSRYDLSSRSGTLLLQPAFSTSAAQNVDLRVADDIASGESLVLSVALPVAAKESTATYTSIGFYLNSSTTSPSTGTHQAFRVIIRDTATASGAATVQMLTNAGSQKTFGTDITSRRIYLRVTRKTVGATDSFVWMYSVDGIVWTVVHLTTAASFTQMWIQALVNTQAAGGTSPVFPVNWVRHVASTAHDLW